MRNRLTIVSCKRCGKSITTVTRSPYGLEQLKAEYGGICEACMPLEERLKLNELIGQALSQNMRQNDTHPNYR